MLMSQKCNEITPKNDKSFTDKSNHLQWVQGLTTYNTSKRRKMLFLQKN